MISKFQNIHALQQSTFDEQCMQRAISLAEHGAGWVSPNPLVGCVIVRNGEVVAEGYHAQYGGSHAEVVALEDARQRGVDVHGATMYVTLEPCIHYGKTPPCAPVVAASGVGRVVVATEDPNPLVAGRGIAALQAEGVQVTVGICAVVVKEQNRIFLRWITTGRPYVCAKVAVSVDGFLTRERGMRTLISGSDAQQFVHRLRHRFDAILVGAGTVVVDNPELSVRDIPNAHQPLRVILDAFGRTSRSVKVYRDGNVMVIRENLTLPAVWQRLGEHGISSVLVEGGQDVLTQCVEPGVVQEWIIVRSSESFGSGVPFVRDIDVFFRQWKCVRTQRVNKDTVEYWTLLEKMRYIGNTSVVRFQRPTGN